MVEREELGVESGMSRVVLSRWAQKGIVQVAGGHDRDMVVGCQRVGHSSRSHRTGRPQLLLDGMQYPNRKGGSTFVLYRIRNALDAVFPRMSAAQCSY